MAKYYTLKTLKNVLLTNVFLFLFPMISILNAASYYVSPFGNDSTGNGSESNPWSTPQKAADNVTAGDTVIVKPGTYYDTNGDGKIVEISRGGTLDKWITFKSDTKSGAIIDGKDRTTMFGFLFLKGANFIRIEGFNIKDLKDTGIVVNNENHDIYVYNNVIHHIGQLQTDIKGGQNGLYSGSNTYNITIDSNYFYEIGRNGTSTNHDHGIYISGNPAARLVIIKNNIFRNRDSGWPIHIYSATGGKFSQITIAFNTFYEENSTRIGQVLLATPIDNLLIENNIFFKPKGAGIRNSTCSGKTNITIRNNITDMAKIIDSESCNFKYSNNITNTNPLLVSPNNPNPEEADYSLTVNSPAIDMVAASDLVFYDYEKNSRPSDGNGDNIKAFDIGAYEYIETSNTTAPKNFRVNNINH